MSPRASHPAPEPGQTAPAPTPEGIAAWLRAMAAPERMALAAAIADRRTLGLMALVLQDTAYEETRARTHAKAAELLGVRPKRLAELIAEYNKRTERKGPAMIEFYERTEGGVTTIVTVAEAMEEGRAAMLDRVTDRAKVQKIDRKRVPRPPAAQAGQLYSYAITYKDDRDVTLNPVRKSSKKTQPKPAA